MLLFLVPFFFAYIPSRNSISFRSSHSSLPILHSPFLTPHSLLSTNTKTSCEGKRSTAEYFICFQFFFSSYTFSYERNRKYRFSEHRELIIRKSSTKSKVYEAFKDSKQTVKAKKKKKLITVWSRIEPTP